MKFEIELIRSAETPAANLERPDAIALRRVVREQTDACIHSLVSDDLSGLLTSCARTMLCVADVVNAYGDDPDVTDLVRGAAECIAMQRQAIDRGVLLTDRGGIRMGAVQLELIMRGIFATLGVPYEPAVRCVFQGEDLRAWLISIGRIEDKGASDGQDAATAAGTAGDHGAPGAGAANDPG